MAEIKKQKNKYRAIQYSTFVGEFVSAATPFVVIGIANYDKYFVEYDGTKMSISFFMALAVMGFAIWGIAKKKMENSFVSMLIMWATMSFIFTMLGEMITDLSTIMWFGFIGLCGSFGLDLISKKAKAQVEKITKAEQTAANDELVEQVKEERKIKVKIKK